MTSRRDSRWTRTLDAATLNAAIAQYLAAYVNVPGTKPGRRARPCRSRPHTPSGRVGTLTVTTDRGNFVLRGNDIRFVLRKPGGEILEQHLFFRRRRRRRPTARSRVSRSTGWAMGMVSACASGARSAARAPARTFATILRAYYPGTAIGPAP